MAEQARDLNGSMSRYQVNTKGSDAAAPEVAAPAAAPTPAAERRKTGRPWSANQAAAAKAPAARASRQANGDDTEWKEF